MHSIILNTHSPKSFIGLLKGGWIFFTLVSHEANGNKAWCLAPLLLGKS
jgi:hypothetical protein